MAAEPRQWSNEAWDDADDADLLVLSREGSSEAFAELWRRHLPAAYAVAIRHKGTNASAEDIVGEASLRIYGLIGEGKGPQSHFRSYFLTTVRTVAVDSARRDLRVVPTHDDDLEVLSGSEAPAYETSVDQELVRRAFAQLSDRDQQVLWHTTVEGRSPSAVAEVMGMSANGVSVAALRAKDSLRGKYLDAHAARAIARAGDTECRWVMERMGRYVRGKLPRRQHDRIRQHIEQCPHAAGLAIEMVEVNRALPALMVPLIFGAACSGGKVMVGALTVAGAESLDDAGGEPPTGSSAATATSGAGGVGLAAVAPWPAIGGVGGAGANLAGGVSDGLVLVSKTVALVMGVGLGAAFVVGPAWQQAVSTRPHGQVGGHESSPTTARTAVVSAPGSGAVDTPAGGVVVPSAMPTGTATSPAPIVTAADMGVPDARSTKTSQRAHAAPPPGTSPAPGVIVDGRRVTVQVPGRAPIVIDPDAIPSGPAVPTPLWPLPSTDTSSREVPSSSPTSPTAAPTTLLPTATSPGPVQPTFSIPSLVTPTTPVPTMTATRNPQTGEVALPKVGARYVAVASSEAIAVEDTAGWNCTAILWGRGSFCVAKTADPGPLVVSKSSGTTVVAVFDSTTLKAYVTVS